VQRGQDRVRIRRAAFTDQEVTIAPQPLSVNHPASAKLAASATAASSPAFEPPREPAQAAADPNLILVKSPIVGTFYEAPSPEAEPFVCAGQRVQPGQVLCIIESMKLMNEIEAEISGVIESQLVRNGQPVEYGEALFGIRTA
jgi:acetyl-CoA carboxylase biotin carboxyl carrier protein